MRLLACADKFRSTLRATEFANAVEQAVRDVTGDLSEHTGQTGWTVRSQPMADGGEGTLESFGGANRVSRVTGPLGEPVEAPWRLSSRRAVIEMAAASGLVLAGGADENDALAATTTGTGELIGRAVDAGATEILIGLGGSATTDGGLGAIRAIPALSRLTGVDLIVACDVRTTFVDAASVFGPQKGASSAEVSLLTARLERLSAAYREEFGVDVSTVEGAGAAGGLAGGLLAIGGRIVPGAEMIADAVDLFGQMEQSDLVITGEGRVDATSFSGKVVGTVIELAQTLERPLPVLVVAGTIDEAARSRLREAGVAFVDLSEDHGEQAALADAAGCVTRSVGRWLRSPASGLRL